MHIKPTIPTQKYHVKCCAVYNINAFEIKINIVFHHIALSQTPVNIRSTLIIPNKTKKKTEIDKIIISYTKTILCYKTNQDPHATTPAARLTRPTPSSG